MFRDTRLPVATVIENLEDLSVEEVMEQFDVTREQITAVLEFVAQSLRNACTHRPQNSSSMLVLFDHGAPRGVFPYCFTPIPLSRQRKRLGKAFQRRIAESSGGSGVRSFVHDRQ